MTSRHETQILAQIRHGKRSWSCADRGGDFVAFRREVVEPLRQLKYNGIIQALSEIESPIAGKMEITGVSIIGAISFQPEEAGE
jgi:hypothetical protein